MKPIVLKAAVIVFFAGFASAQRLPSSPMPTKVTDEELRVVAAAVAEICTTATTRWFYISNLTTTFECDPPAPTGLELGGCAGMRTRDQNPRGLFVELATDLKELTPEWFMDLYAKTQTTTVVDKTLPLSIKQTIWGPTSTAPLPPEWGTPDFAIYHSRVGFNDKRTAALVYVASINWTDQSKSNGEYVTLTLKESKWVVSNRHRKWSLQKAR